EVKAGKVFLESIRAVLLHGFDLLIKPAESPDWVDRLFGSNDMHLLRKCPCPVWLMKPSPKKNHANVVAAIDFDPNEPESVEDALNRQILELSSAVALSNSAAFHVVHAW